MVYGIYQSAAGMQVNQYRQEVLANNLANVATTAFKPDVAVVHERAPETVDGNGDPTLSAANLAGLTGGSFVAPTYTSFSPGPVEITGNPLDVSIPDDGFFAVRDGNTTRYTRDGRFTINERGELVTASGHLPVLSDGGGSITIPSNASARARIDANGEVRSGSTSFGQIGIVRFADKAGLRKVGRNLVEASDRPLPTDSQLQTGAIEGSAVDPMQTMVSMIEVTRAYQLNATMVGLADSTLGRAVNDIARMR